MDKKLVEKLQNIGLTQNESRVYLFLLEYQEAKTGIICSKLNIANSHIYKILEKLLDKGLVSYKISNNIKIFQAVNPDSLYELFREKEEQLEKEKQDLKKFISSLKTIEIKDKRQNDFKYFEGTIGVKSMFNEFIRNMSNNSTCYITAAPIAFEKWNAFFHAEFHPQRIQKKVNLKLIVPIKVKKFGKQKEKLKPVEVKYFNLDLDSEIGVNGDYTYILSYGDKPYALLIKDKNFAKSQINIFKMLWGKANVY